MGLIEALGPGPVAVDTAIFIYFVERHPTWAGAVRPMFAAADGGDLTLVTSALTLLEVLVVPLRAGDAATAERYERLLTRSPGLTLLEIDRPLLRVAARLRAVSRLRTPDAIQVAAALSAGCPTFLTNDRDLPAIAGINVVQLAQFGPDAGR